MKILTTLVAMLVPILAFGADAAPMPPVLEGGSSSSPSSHAYFKMLAAHPNMVLTKAFSSASRYPGGPAKEVVDTYIWDRASSRDAGRWTYDSREDAVRLRWPAQDESLSSGHQLRWGGSGGYTPAVESDFGTLGTGTFLFVWDWKFDKNWTAANRVPRDNVLQTHKAHQISGNNMSDRMLEIRYRYSGSAGQFAGPSGNQVAFIDVRPYVGNGSAAGGSIPQLATIYPEGGEWIRLFAFVDGGSLEFSLWGQKEGGPIVQMIDQMGGFSTAMRNIDGFWFEMNSSQEGGSGISVESYNWGRNWVVLKNLSYNEAAALVHQSSW